MYRDGLSLCQVWHIYSQQFWFNRADRVTEADDRYTHATTVNVSNNN